jgi:hypothetical protein
MQPKDWIKLAVIASTFLGGGHTMTGRIADRMDKIEAGQTELNGKVEVLAFQLRQLHPEIRSIPTGPTMGAEVPASTLPPKRGESR